MSVHERCADDTVISVDIDEVIVDLVRYIAESYGNSCSIADFRSTTHASELEDDLFIQLERFCLYREGKFGGYRIGGTTGVE
jgi:hypothetical protein